MLVVGPDWKASPTPEVMQVMEVSETTVKERQGEFVPETLRDTVVAPVKSVPVIVMVSPPRKCPEFGETLVTVGGIR